MRPQSDANAWLTSCFTSGSGRPSSRTCLISRRRLTSDSVYSL